jgi:hypothetical protein
MLMNVYVNECMRKREKNVNEWLLINIILFYY